MAKRPAEEEAWTCDAERAGRAMLRLWRMRRGAVCSAQTAAGQSAGRVARTGSKEWDCEPELGRVRVRGGTSTLGWKNGIYGRCGERGAWMLPRRVGAYARAWGDPRFGVE